jgi:DNA-binding IscR family transcriptional regulator
LIVNLREAGLVKTRHRKGGGPMLASDEASFVQGQEFASMAG